MDSGFGSTNNHRRLSKEDRQSELFDAYGIHEIPNGKPYGTKRAQLRAHLASAETTWATPQHRIPSSMKPYSSRSEHLDHGRAYSHQDSSQQHRWDFDTEEHQDSVFEAEPRQLRGGKRKKKNPSVRTAFQVKLENENQLRVSREARSPYPSPQRLGAATKRAAKARHKRIAATGHSSMAAKSASGSSESLNDYATQLFQDSASRGGTHFPARSRLTPREKEEIRERERLSFAEKLHKMIDKAKSTLASGNTMDSVPFPPKSSKAARKTPTERRPLSERTRTLVSTPKQVEKEVLTPRETAETRPAKPTSRTSKRSESSSVPVVQRPKPTITRSVVTPKSTTDTRSRGGKTTKAAPTKTAQVEKPKETAVKSIPVEATPVANTLEVDGPHPDKAFDQPVEEVGVVQETGPTIPVEPEASSSDVAVEMETDAVPSNAASQLPVEPTPLENRTVMSSDESSKELPRIGAAVDDAAIVVQTETPDASISPSQAVEVDVAPETTADAPELPEDSVVRQTLLEEPSAVTEPTVDLPSGGNTAVDAMYGDAFNEFDDNGGEDEDMTVEGEAEPDDTHTPAPESSDLKGNPMQESKSGEALYDDYDEFDEDEPSQDEDVEVEDNPVEVAAAEITTPSTETEPNPVENVPEGEGEAETPAVVPEDSDSAFPGGDDRVHLDGNGGDVDAEPSESKPEAGHEPQPEVSSNDHAPGDPQHDFVPVVGSTEDQESVNLDIVSSTVPSDENAADGDPYSNPVDDPDKVDDATESAPDKGTRENIGTKPDTDAEPTEAEGAVENTETSAQLEGETSESRLLDEAIVSVDITTEETNVNPVLAQQDEEDKADITAQQDAPDHTMSDEAATSIKQDNEAKKLTADSSVASVQSAAYDEDNFDDEVKLEETGPNEADNVAAAEEAGQAVGPQQEDKSPDTAPNPEPIAAVSSDPEDESKVLVANSSELSVQSAAYDDDGFEDGAQEDSQADASENKAPEQEPSVDEKPDSVAVDVMLEADVGDNPIASEPNCDGGQEEQAPENEAPTATSAPEGEDFNNSAVDEAPKAMTPESAPETVDVASVLAPESGVIAEPSVVTVSGSPDTLAQEEEEKKKGNVQETANLDAEKDEGAGQVDDKVGSANEGDTVLTPEPDIDESPALISTEETVTDPSTTADTLEDETSERNTLTDATPAQDEDKISEIATPSEPVEAQNEAEGSEQPASYDDDNFVDNEEAVPNVETVELDLVAKEAADEGLENMVSELQSSEQQGDDIGDSPTAVVDNEDSAAKEEEIPPEGNLEELSHPKQAEEDATDSSVVLGKPDEFASDFVSENGNPSENEEDHVEAPIENEPAVDPVSDEVGDSMPAIEPSRYEITATPAKQPDDQDVSVSPDDESLGVGSAADAPQAESIPDPDVEPDVKVESSDSATGLSQDAVTTEEAREEPASESEQRPSDIVSTDTPAEPSSVDDTTEYDAEFDDTENDDIPLKDDTPENGPIQNEIGANDEVAPEYGDAEFDDTENDAVVLKKDNEPILNEIDVTEEATPGDNLSGTATDEAADQLTDEQTANEDTNESVAEEVNEPTTDSAAADADEPTLANVDLELSNPTATEEEIKAEADVDPTVASVGLEANNPPVTEEAKTEANVDASQYEEDFPDETSPETQDTQDTEPIYTNVEAADSANTPTETEAVSIEANPDNDENASELVQSASDEVAVPDLPKDEVYDDGFDDDNTAPAVAPNDSSNPIETSSTTDRDRATNGADSSLEGNTDATLDKSNAKVEESDVADTVEVQPTEVPVQSDPLESEPVSFGEVEPGTMEPETAPVEVEVEDSAPIEPETVACAPVEPPLEVEPSPMEPEASTLMIEMNESGVDQLETGEPDALRDEVVEPVTVQSEVEEVESGEVNVVESEGNTESKAADPPGRTLTAASLDEDPEHVERSPLESVTADTVASVPEGQEEKKITDPSTEHPSIQDAGQEELLSEPSEVSTPIKNKSDATEVPVKTEVETPTKDGSATGEEAKEDASLEEKALIEEVAVDQHQDEVPLEDTTSSLVEAPPAENPVEAATDEQEQPAQSEAEHTPGPGPVRSEDVYLADDNSGGAVDSADGVSQENQEAVAESSSTGDTDQVNEGPIETTVEPMQTPKPTEAISEPSNDAQPIVEGQQISDEPDYAEDDETYEAQSIVHDKASINPSQEDRQVGAESPNNVVKSDTAQGNVDTDETTSEAIETPEPTEAIVKSTHKEQRTVEGEASDEPDYAEDDTMEDESLKDDSKIVEDLTGVENAEPLPQELALQDSVNVPEADELAIESELPEPDQTVASSEGPKTEDQYDDDEGYNEFDDQENDSPPTVEVPAPATTAVTKAPASEDEYDEYENDEYGEEEKPSETPRIAPKVANHSTLNNPPTSAREEEIDEVADEPEEAEEDAYADDQEEYEEDEAPTVPKTSSPPKQDKSVPKQAEAEASTDEYEDDNEEDYADDDIEDSSPPKPAPAVRAAKSDDEMEEELESEEDYASD
ncbi:hypothetical protein P3T76_008107 [Phytophthora citrophthora]|uniref:Uncharacterized protein n=1 Tax=Phytophthora citrophthora TaxID=4793 RepID=A0AAD9LLN0_9STRA|nr:hypothetical protein P3T76_008107 [Phytophthora citrophthora]